MDLLRCRWFSQSCRHNMNIKYVYCADFGRKGVTNLLRDDLVWSPVAVGQLHVRLHLHAVQVFVQAVEQEGQQLLTVVLLESVEARRVLADRPLQADETNIRDA